MGSDRVTDDSGASDEDWRQVTILNDNIPPVADPGGVPLDGSHIGQVGVAVTFDGSKSSDSDGFVATWEWDFGDGNTGEGEIVQHTYDSASIYHGHLTVTDNEDSPASNPFDVAIGMGSVPPVADAGGPYGGAVGALVSFDGTGSSAQDGLGIASYAWKFGDGASGSGPPPRATPIRRKASTT